jgi:hypothetical protein
MVAYLNCNDNSSVSTSSSARRLDMGWGLRKRVWGKKVCLKFKVLKFRRSSWLQKMLK